MTDKKDKSLREIINEEGVIEKPKKKRTRRKKTTTPKAPKKTKKEKTEDLMNEVEADAKKINEENKSEYPDITLPVRGYFAKGDRGVNVERLQRVLNLIVDANIPIDGIVGPETLAGVLKFEKQYGGFPNGMFGETELKLYNEMR